MTWKFVDTAGIRRRVHRPAGADYYASLRTAAAVEKAEVAVVLIDASETITEQDTAHHHDGRRGRPRPRHRLQQVGHPRRGAPLLPGARDRARPRPGASGRPGSNVSARTGRHMEKLVPAIETALDGWETRVPTGRLNAFLGELVAAAPAPDPRRQAAPHPVRHAGRHQAAALRALRLRLPRGRLPPLHRAPAARGVRLRGHADPDLGAGAREAPAADARRVPWHPWDSVGPARMG